MAAIPPTADGEGSTILQTLASFVHGVRYDDLPSDVVRYAKTLILDTLGCAYGALHSDVAIAMRKVAADCGGKPQATLIGTGEKTSAPMATLVNGSLLRYLDCNDYAFGRDPAHPSGNLAAALAVAEREGRSGRELIAALTAAYEVHLRLCEHAGGPTLWGRGWHHGTNAQFSSAAVAGRLSWNDPVRTAHAMAIAGSHQNTLALLQSGAISMIKASAEAWVAKAGVEAALLAGHGMTGPLTLMEGPNGWAATVAGEVDFAALLAPQDGRWRLAQTSIKPYPVVATALAPVRAAIQLHREGLPPAGRIAKMVVRLPRFALGTPSAHAGRRFPAAIESAQHSFYYCAVIALLDGDCGEAQFLPQRLADPAVRALLEKVVLQEDAAFNDRWPQAAGGGIDLHLDDGSKRSASCPFPPGHPSLPLDDAELAAKFFTYAEPVLGRAGAQALHDAVMHMERYDDVRNLTAMLSHA